MSVILPLIIISTLILFFLYSQMNRNINRQINSQSMNILSKYNNFRSSLSTTVKLISQTPEIVNGTEIGKINLIIQTLVVFSKELRIPFIAVHDKDGYALGKSHKPGEKFKNDSKEEYVKKGLSLKKNINKFITHTKEGLGILSITPIYSSSAEKKFTVSGIATAGFLFNNKFAKMLKGTSEAEVFFLYKNKIIGSSIEKIYRNKTFTRMTTKENIKATKYTIKIEEKNYEIKKIPLIKKNKFSYLNILIAIDSTQQKSTMRVTVFIVTLFLLSSIIISFIFSLRISKKITTPVNNLLETSKKIAQGNYEVRADVNSKDELELLGDTFNMMVEQLQRNIDTLDKEVEKRTQELKYAYDIIKEDLFLAKRVQRNFLASNYSDFKNIEISVFFQPMMEVGGDIYDLFELKENYYRIMIADATGHGVQAALMTMIIKSEYDKIKTYEIPPNQILKIFNGVFLEHYFSLNLFFTCIIIDIDINKNKIYYSFAGHPNQYLIQNKKISVLQAGGKLIGIVEDNEYELKEQSINSGDKIILFTDGLFEEFSQENKELGETGLKKIISKNIKPDIKEMVKSIKSEVKAWTDNSKFTDDIVLIGLEIK